MRILVYGAGNIGSLYAARLKDSGHDVVILARGDRGREIRERGILLEDSKTGQQSATDVKTVDQLAPDDAYDLVLVVLPRHCIAEVLPILAANNHTPSVMFFGNNAAGSDAMIQSLGRRRVLLGFPGAAAVVRDARIREGHIRYLILRSREQPTTVGEVDGAESRRIDDIAGALQTAGFPVSICPNMDAWLKTHVAEISPTANALYMAGGDIGGLKRTRDAQVLMLRAIGEGYRVLSALGIPITPSNHRIIRWIPEPLLLRLMSSKLGEDATSIKIGHASAAREEMKTIADEFSDLAARSGVDTPSIDTLRGYLAGTEPIADGSSEIPVTWRPVWIALCVVVVVVGLVWQLLR